MSNEIEMMNNDVITETVEEVAEKANESSNKLIKGFAAGVGTTVAVIAGIKYVIKPVLAKAKTRHQDETTASGNYDEIELNGMPGDE